MQSQERVCALLLCQRGEIDRQHRTPPNGLQGVQQSLHFSPGQVCWRAACKQWMGLLPCDTYLAWTLVDIIVAEVSFLRSAMLSLNCTDPDMRCCLRVRPCAAPMAVRHAALQRGHEGMSLHQVVFCITPLRSRSRSPRSLQPLIACPTGGMTAHRAPFRKGYIVHRRRR